MELANIDYEADYFVGHYTCVNKSCLLAHYFGMELLAIATGVKGRERAYRPAKGRERACNSHTSCIWTAAAPHIFVKYLPTNWLLNMDSYDTW